MGIPFMNGYLLEVLQIEEATFGRTDDLQAAKLFPVCHNNEELGKVFRWMIFEPEFAEGQANMETSS